MSSAGRDFVRYAAVGSIGTVAHYGLLVVLASALGVPPYLAAAAGFVLGALVNYLLNHRLTFRSRRPHREALPRFLLVAAAGLLFTTALMAAATAWLRLPYLPAQMATTVLLLLLTFAGNRRWTFG